MIKKSSLVLHVKVFAKREKFRLDIPYYIYINKMP